MKESLLVSIIIPVYNGEKFIERAIQSCINQTYNNIEILVIDNESTDRTTSILKTIEDKRVKVLYSCKGRGKARNIGLKEAKGQYITFLDADDTLKKDRISKGILYLQNNPSIYGHAVSVEYLNNLNEII